MAGNMFGKFPIKDITKDLYQRYINEHVIPEREIREKQAAQESEKRRINEKQIRQLRNRYRPAGFLNNKVGVASSGLGESAELPNKLGG